MSTPPKTSEPRAPGESADDPSIPVLTERLGLPPLDFDTTLPLIESTGQNQESAFAALTALPDPPPAPLPRSRIAPLAPPEPINVLGTTGGTPGPVPHSGTDSGHWARIEIELRTSILREIANQLPREVEAIVRTRMNAAIERVLNSLAADTRLAIAASLRDIVERAVHAELERLRNSNRG